MQCAWLIPYDVEYETKIESNDLNTFFYKYKCYIAYSSTRSVLDPCSSVFKTNISAIPDQIFPELVPLSICFCLICSHNNTFLFFLLAIRVFFLFAAEGGKKWWVISASGLWISNLQFLSINVDYAEFYHGQLNYMYAYYMASYRDSQYRVYITNNNEPLSSC